MTRSYAILTDTTRCTGCEKCVEACRSEHELGEDVPRRWKARIDDLSSTRYTTIVRRPEDRFVRQQCRHCLEPACVSACLVGALTKTEEGAVIYDGNRCMGCRYCMVACPYGIPRYDWENRIPYVRKCTMCYERIKGGKKLPACVEACPEEATEFGDRDELIHKAKRRIKENPGKYVDRVFGQTEVGGTSVIYLSDVPLDFLSFQPELGDTPLPERTWAALSKVPPIALGVGGVMAGVWWIIGRRAKLADEAARSAAAAQDAPPEPSETMPSPEKREKE